MALGTWQINNPHAALAWENLDKGDSEHQQVLASGVVFLRDTGLAGALDQVTDLFPFAGPWDLLYAPVSIVGYNAGILTPAISDPLDPATYSHIANLSASGGGFIVAGTFAGSVSGARGGSMTGVWLPPGMRLRTAGLNAGTSATILVAARRRR